MYSEMLTDGIVVDLGHGMSQISPVTDGYTSQFCSKSYKVTGEKVDDYLLKLLYSNYGDQLKGDNKMVNPQKMSRDEIRKHYELKKIQAVNEDGKEVDHYLMEKNENYLLVNYCLWAYKIKMDLKETGFSPYRIPFNYEVLQEKMKIDPSNHQAYREYLLPDGKTVINF